MGKPTSSPLVTEDIWIGVEMPDECKLVLADTVIKQCGLLVAILND